MSMKKIVTYAKFVRAPEWNPKKFIHWTDEWVKYRLINGRYHVKDTTQSKKYVPTNQSTFDNIVNKASKRGFILEKKIEREMKETDFLDKIRGNLRIEFGED